MKVVLFKRNADGIWQFSRGELKDEVVTIGKQSWHIKKPKQNNDLEKPELIEMKEGFRKKRMYPLYFVDNETAIPFEFEEPKEEEIEDPENKNKKIKFKSPSPTHLHALLVRDTWTKILNPTKIDTMNTLILIGFGFMTGIVATIIFSGMV